MSIRLVPHSLPLIGCLFAGCGDDTQDDGDASGDGSGSDGSTTGASDGDSGDGSGSGDGDGDGDGDSSSGSGDGDTSSSDSSSDGDSDSSSGGDGDMCAMMGEIQCSGSLTCQPVYGNDLEPGGQGTWCHSPEQSYYGCIPAEPCPEIISFWCEGQDKFMTPNGCGLPGWENCGMPQGYNGVCG